MEAALLESLHPAAARPPRAGAKRSVAWSAAAAFLLHGLGSGNPTGHLEPPRVTFRSDDLATVRTLADRDELRAGDHVFLEFESGEDLYVYVLNEDSEGERFLLFPFLGATASNPLPGGRSHRLPGVDQDWEASPGGGEDWVCVLASRRPLEELEQILSHGTAGGAAEGSGIQYLQVDTTSAARLAGTLRSLGGLVSARRSRDAPVERDVDLRDVVMRLAGDSGNEHSVWVQSLRFRNK